MRILFVLAHLAGDEPGEVLQLARALDPTRYAIEIVACARGDSRDDAHVPFEAVGVRVDRTAYHLPFEGTLDHLAGLIPGFDAVVSCQNVADIYPALERLHLRPPLIEYGTRPHEAADGPKHFTTRYVGVNAAVRDAAAARLQGRERDAIEIASLAGVRGVRATVKVVRHWERVFDGVRRAPAPPPEPLFRSFWQGGFECSTHRRSHDRARVDVIAATRHDTLAELDYRKLQQHGMWTVRDGLRWHLIERSPGQFDWSSLERQLAGAKAAGTEVLWDLLHYGWPDDVDVWSAAFVPRFAAFAAAAARVVAVNTTGTRIYCPVNEISFLSWGGGDVEYLNPFARGRGFELKVQLARASIAAMEAIRAIDPDARFVHCEPAINIITDPGRPWEASSAEGLRQGQFQSWDLVAGRMWPQLGGRPELLDVVGLNYYHNNQWIHGGPPIDREHPLYKPFRFLLAETYARYGRPIFVSETGIEGEARPAWLAYIAGEVRAAQALGVPVAGLCLYPVLDHPGWDNERHCPNGLLTTAPDGHRDVNAPLAAELRRQQGFHAQPIGLIEQEDLKAA